MSRPVLLALIAVGLLSACGGRFVGPPPQPGMAKAFTDSAGFTGVGYELQ